MPVGLAKCLCQPPFVGNWARDYLDTWWQTGTKALIMPLQSVPTGLYAHPQGTNLAYNSLDGVECTAHHPGSGSVPGTLSVTMSPLSIKDFAVAIFHQNGACWGWPALHVHKYGSRLFQAVCREIIRSSQLLLELFWEVIFGTKLKTKSTFRRLKFACIPIFKTNYKLKAEF